MIERIGLTKKEADRITDALDREEINITEIEHIVRHQILREGDCSPILQGFKTAIASGSESMKEKAAHELRSIWRLCSWESSEDSRIWLKLEREKELKDAKA